MTIELELIRRGFVVEIAAGRSVAEKCCICDTSIISKEFEKIVYTTPEYDDNVIGIFLHYDNQLVASCVVDVTCSSTVEKYVKNWITPSQTKRSAIPRCAEIVLLCSSQKHRIGAASMLMDLTMEKLVQYGLSHVTLSVAGGLKNPRAIQFYERYGFEFVNPDESQLMFLDLRAAREAQIANDVARLNI
jgi:hypothetical protein